MMNYNKWITYPISISQTLKFEVEVKKRVQKKEVKKRRVTFFPFFIRHRNLVTY